MSAILIMILMNGTIKTKQLPNMGVCEQVKIEVQAAKVKDLKKVFCAKK